MKLHVAWRVVINLGFGLLVTFGASTLYAEGEAGRTVRVTRGKPTIVEFSGLTKVTVSDISVLSVTLLSGDRVVLQGKKPGRTTLECWREGAKETVTVEVEDGGLPPAAKEDETSSEGSASEATASTVPSEEESRTAESSATPGEASNSTKPTGKQTDETDVSTPSEITPVARPHLWLSMQVSPLRDRQLQYAMTCGNKGGATATEVMVRASLPEGTEYVTDSASDTAAFDPEKRELSWSIGDLPAGSDRSDTPLSFAVAIKGEAEGAREIAAMATMQCKEVETLIASNVVSYKTVSPALAAVLVVADRFVAKRTPDSGLADVRRQESRRMVDRLRGLGILDGYPNSTFRADQDATRCESVKMVVLSTKMKELQDATRLSYVLTREAKVSIVVRDASGAIVSTLADQLLERAGDHALIWEGKGDAGQYLTPGDYRLEVTGVDEKGGGTTLSAPLTLLSIPPRSFTEAPTFKDVSPLNWYAGYLAEAQSRHYVVGYPDGSFRPLRSLSRVEASAIIIRALGLQEEATKRKAEDVGFLDAKQIPRWASGYVAVAATSAPKAKNRLIIGYPDNKFLPLNPVKRAEVAAMMERFVDRDVPRKVVVAGAVSAGTLLTLNGKAPATDANGEFREPLELSPETPLTIAVLSK